ncbi:hypothetical protein ACLB2K_060174 [Fragaria x ananassa]
MNDLFINSSYDGHKFKKILTLCWQIWQKRNDCVFRHKPFSAHSVVVCAASYFQPNSRAISNTILSPRCDSSIKWTPPPPGVLKINFDGSVVQPSSNAAMGFLLRDDAGCPIVAAARSFGKTTVPVAEAIALRDSLLKAKEKEFKKLTYFQQGYHGYGCTGKGLEESSTLDMAKLLARHGLEVTIITAPLNAIGIKPIIDRAVDSGLFLNLVQFSLPLSECGLPEGCETLESVPARNLFQNFFDAVSRLQQPVEQLLETVKPIPSCIISDKHLPWTGEIAQKFGIPSPTTGTAAHLNPSNVDFRDFHREVEEATKGSSGVSNCVEYVKEYRKPRQYCYSSVARAWIRPEASNRPFVWVISGDKSEEWGNWLLEGGFEDRIKGRGLLIHGWAPQILILSHPAVGGFLTHCGWNSTLEAICAGIPMITWPMFAEQFYNEKFIVQVLKIGVTVGASGVIPLGKQEGSVVSVKSGQFKEAIEKVMSKEGNKEGEDRRERARKLAMMANKSTLEGGSSYHNIRLLTEDIRSYRNKLAFQI